MLRIKTLDTVLKKIRNLAKSVRAEVQKYRSMNIDDGERRYDFSAPLRCGCWLLELKEAS